MKVNNHTDLDLTELEQQVDRFYPYSKQQLGFDQDPQSINFVSDPDNATDMLGKTAFYDPESFSITIYADNRHPKDMMRSLSHELVHHAQNCRGEFDNEMDLGEGYAQEDEHMRNMEKEAYSLGNIVFRDWEDGMKKVNETTSYNKGGKSFRRNRELDNTGDVYSPVPARAITGARFLADFIAKHPTMEPGDNKMLDKLIAIQNQRELERSEKDTAIAIINKYKTGVTEMIATPDTVKDAMGGDEEIEEMRLSPGGYHNQGDPLRRDDERWSFDDFEDHEMVRGQEGQPVGLPVGRRRRGKDRRVKKFGYHSPEDKYSDPNDDIYDFYEEGKAKEIPIHY